MGNKKIIQGIKNEVKSFFQAVGKTSELVYLVLLTLYVALFYFLKIAWVDEIQSTFDTIRYSFLGLIMWGSALYLLFVIAEWKNLWKKTIILIILAAALLTGTYFFSRRMTTNLYGVVMDVFFCVLAYRKDFRKILKCMLGVSVVMMLIAAVGLPLHLTLEVEKPNFIIATHSLGINYPNTWGYLAFLALVILWYLYLRNKAIITVVLFWVASLFMYFYIGCRTIAGLAIVFPVCAIVVDLIEKRIDQEIKEGTFRKNRILEWIITGIPYIAWAIMMFLSVNVDWIYQFYQGGALRNMAWRFLQGGLYFQTYGIPLVGNPYRSNQHTFINVQNEFVEVGILDSSFAAYTIMRGILWIAYTMLWLCVAHRKALKKRDYAIILIAVFFLGFAMMERPGLEMWYNFVLLYPLAKVISKPRTEKFLDFDQTVEPDKGTAITENEKEYKTFMGIKTFPPYRVEEGRSKVEVGYDFTTYVHTLGLPSDVDKECLFEALDHIYAAEKYVRADQERLKYSKGFIEYHTGQVMFINRLGAKTVNDSLSFSMGDVIGEMTVEEYVQDKYRKAVDASETQEPAEALPALYYFLGVKSICEMYAGDFDRSKYDMNIFSEKLGRSVFNKIDNHMHGKADEFLFNTSIADYREALVDEEQIAAEE